MSRATARIVKTSTQKYSALKCQIIIVTIIIMCNTKQLKFIQSLGFPSLMPEASARPIYSWKIIAGETTGFKSPAQDYEQEELDLNKRYVVNKPATFFFTVGKDYDSMIDAGILPGGIVIVDCSLKPRHTSIVVAAVEDEWMVKRLYRRNGKIKLLSENKERNYPPIEFDDGRELLIFGIARTAINDLR